MCMLLLRVGVGCVDEVDATSIDEYDDEFCAVDTELCVVMMGSEELDEGDVENVLKSDDEGTVSILDEDADVNVDVEDTAITDEKLEAGAAAENELEAGTELIELLDSGGRLENELDTGAAEDELDTATIDDDNDDSGGIDDAGIEDSGVEDGNIEVEGNEDEGSDVEDTIDSSVLVLEAEMKELLVLLSIGVRLMLDEIEALSVDSRLVLMLATSDVGVIGAEDVKLESVAVTKAISGYSCSIPFRHTGQSRA
jgi:hypothetical protein